MSGAEDLRAMDPDFPPPLSDPQFRVPAIPIRHIDQASDPADKSVFIASQDPIRIGDLP